LYAERTADPMDIYDQTIDVLSELHINTQGATSETRLKEDLEMDSTELIEIEIALEKHFAIPVDHVAFTRLPTLGDITQFIQFGLESKSIGER
jgi:acyl carrier protein